MKPKITSKKKVLVGKKKCTCDPIYGGIAAIWDADCPIHGNNSPKKGKR